MRIRTRAQVAVVALLLGLLTAGSTAQGAGEAGVVHFTAAGDYASTTNTDAVLDRIRLADPDLALALGDMSYGDPGGEPAWCDYVTSHLGAGFPFELVAGDNESGGQDGHINDFSACLPNQLAGLVGTYGRQWYLDVPQVDPLVRFVMVSAALPFPDGVWSYAVGTPRYDWTAAAIDGARANGIPWVVVGTHEPCISLGPTCSIGEDLLNLLLTKRVDLVLHGHEHLYARTHQLALGTACPRVQLAYDADCVVDGNAEMSQGVGTVFATVGTGGRSLTTIGATDAELPYFPALSHAGRTPAYGFLDVRATADDLTAQFVATNASTFTDGFTIHRGDPPPNVAPTAAFTSSSSGLTATFDGRTSTDPDGPITSYSWDFGDGTPAGSGAQPSHTYAAADTYQVTLTVADSAGATNSITRPVTVELPLPTADFVADAFGRTVSNGWGPADVGGAWSIAGTASNFAVNGGSGAITLPSAGQTRSAWLGSTTRTDTDLRLSLSLDRRPNGNGAYLDVVGRRVSTNNEYRARLIMSANGRITVQLATLRGTGTPVGLTTGLTLPTTITYAAGTPTNVRLQVTGTHPTTLRLKVWPATQTEPTAWQATATDSFAALQNPGAVGFTGYLPSGVTTLPVVLRLDDLTARPT